MLRKSKSPPPPRRLQNTAPLPPPEVMDDATFLCVLLALILTIIALVCLISPYLWTSGRPGILLSKDGTTWEAAHWSSYDVNSPPSGDNNSTRVIISLTRVTAKLVHGEDLSLSFMLMQQWSDPRLVVRGGENKTRSTLCISFFTCMLGRLEEKPEGPTVQNIEAIKGTDSPISIWKPTLGTDSFIRVVDKSRDETWLWKDGRVLRRQPATLILSPSRHDETTSEYLFKIFTTREFTTGKVALTWNSSDPISFNNETSPQVMGENSKNSRFLYSTGHCDMTYGPDSATQLKRSCLKVGFKLEKTPTSSKKELDRLLSLFDLSLGLIILIVVYVS
ncbi:uncharacterized protein LOC110855439 [Folsomia candida]|uniref:uncharacterized protein LOC110855439 n=1 Tax=Folsomia candida TaxID=158441 RepID=UPI001604A834|nr:uncharacterized protein LOC110855439 [Folsomia candida]